MSTLLHHPLTSPAQIRQHNAALARAGLPRDLVESIRLHTARLTTTAGRLLRLGPEVVGAANVLLLRYWVGADADGGSSAIMRHEFADVSAAVVYLVAKISQTPRSPRSVANVYHYLARRDYDAQRPWGLFGGSISIKEDLVGDGGQQRDQKDQATTAAGSEIYLSETEYHTYRTRLFHVEGLVLAALGFTVHVALPHVLCITYMQTLDFFASSSSTTTSASPARWTGAQIAKRAIAHLNAALWSPQMLYLTHPPSALATAAIYLAAREGGWRIGSAGGGRIDTGHDDDDDEPHETLPWWEVFDTDREDLGFLCVALRSLEGMVRRDEELWRWSGRDGAAATTTGSVVARTTVVLTRADVRAHLRLRRRRSDGDRDAPMDGVDEEEEMGRMLDAKVGG